MSEGLNGEVAHKLTEKEEAERRKHRREKSPRSSRCSSSQWLRWRPRGAASRHRSGMTAGASCMDRQRLSVSLPLLPPPLAANSWPRTLAAASECFRADS